MTRDVVLYSPLDPVAIAKRLRKLLGARKGKPKKGVTGRGNEQEMMLFVYGSGAAPARTRLTAVMDPEGTGTRIEGRSRRRAAWRAG